MTVHIVVGSSFGDCGKGRFIDVLAEKSDLVVRTNGGPNAGHTIIVGERKLVFRLVPSGVLHPKTVCVLGHGTVLDPYVFNAEVNKLQNIGINLKNRLFVSDSAHLIMPYHIKADSTDTIIGTTKKGIGPCYQDKMARTGIRIGELKNNKVYGKASLNNRKWYPYHTRDSLKKYLEFSKMVFSPFITNTSNLINDSLDRNENILLEGAQGSLLDIDCGTYPFVTSSSTTATGICAGAGIGPTQVNLVMGVLKAYVTRVGSGPFPTEIEGEVGNRIRTIGGEFGSVTGRPRRVGWLDLPALRYAARINGMNCLAIAKLDVLSEFDEIKICDSYKREFDINNLPNPNEVNYVSFKSWPKEIENVREFSKLPNAAIEFIRYIEDKIKIPITMISVGPERNQLITLC